MDPILASFVAGAGGAGAVIAIIRFLGPIGVSLVGGILKTKAELDADRDRVILNLRGEVDDLTKQLEGCRDGWADTRKEAERAVDRVAELEGFIDRFLENGGYTRADVQNGKPWTGRRRSQ